MRTQQRDQILKEAKYARHSKKVHTPKPGFFSRIWLAVTSMFHR